MPHFHVEKPEFDPPEPGSGPLGVIAQVIVGLVMAGIVVWVWKHWK